NRTVELPIMHAEDSPDASAGVLVLVLIAAFFEFSPLGKRKAILVSCRTSSTFAVTTVVNGSLSGIRVFATSVSQLASFFCHRGTPLSPATAFCRNPRLDARDSCAGRSPNARLQHLTSPPTRQHERDKLQRFVEKAVQVAAQSHAQRNWFLRI